MEILFFHGRYCPACKQAESIVKECAGNIPVYTFDVQDVYGGYSKMKEYHVEHVPCAIVVDNGEVKARADGAVEEEKFKEMLNGLTPKKRKKSTESANSKEEE